MLQIDPITPRLGAEVFGLDLAALCADEMSELRRAFITHRVLVFRNQQLDRDAHKAFGRRFGTLQTHPAKTQLGMAGDPEIFEISIGSKTRVANGESDALLQLLFRHIEANTRIQCRVRWAPNTLVLWDNMGVHHHAVWDYFL